MSGQFVSTLRGKIPQRAIRHLGELPYAVSYCDEAVDFGGAGETAVFATPSTRRGKILAIDLYNFTESIAATTQPNIQIGDGADADLFAFTGDLADGSAARSLNAADGSLSIGAQEIIDAGDQVTITYVAGITTPTGICNVATTVLYFE